MRTYIFVFLLFLFPNIGYSNSFDIDERKCDIYFANGVLTDEDTAHKNLKLIYIKILDEIYSSNEVKMNKELNFDTAYNQTLGFTGDFYESLMQKKDESFGWSALHSAVYLLFGGGGIFSYIYEKMNKIVHDADLTTQVRKYRNSIRKGHKVIVVAHSQGNLFTNEAFKSIISNKFEKHNRPNGWMKNYFKRVSVATPSNYSYGGSLVISFHNDPVPSLGSLPKIKNPNKAITKNALGEIIDTDAMSTDFHAFTYYMGEKTDSSSSHGAVSTNIAKNMILNFIKGAIESHKGAPSQWLVSEEIKKGTKNYRILVKHKFDSSIIVRDSVFPFAPDKKLYPVPDENNKTHYVKASFDGEKIKDLQADWLNGCNNDLDFYLLEGTGEKITGLPVKWEKISEKNRGTCDWRLTVENNLTKEVLTDVYPFDPDNGHVYKLDTGEVVMAKCGGETLLDNWEGKRIYNCYLLKETNEKINIDMNITVTGKITTAECKMTQKAKNESFGFWAEGCKYTNVEDLHKYVYSRSNTFHQLPPCKMLKEPLPEPFGPKLGESLDTEVPEGFVMVDENITKVIHGTFPAYNGMSVVYTNIQKPTNGEHSIFCYGMVSSFTWSEDEYSGILETKYFTRKYRPAEK